MGARSGRSFIGLPVQALVKRVDSTLAELVEALGLEGSSTGAVLGEVREMVTQIASRYDSEVQRLRRENASHVYFAERYESVLCDARDRCRARISLVSRGLLELDCGDATLCHQDLMALKDDLEDDLASFDVPFVDPSEEQIAGLMRIEESFSFLDAASVSADGAAHGAVESVEAVEER